ncbi:MAG: hypothetical protein ACRYFL_01850 [Janthinobacterium lividum]
MSFLKASVKSLLAMFNPQDFDYLTENFINLKLGNFKNNVEFRMQLPDLKEYFLRLSLFYSKQPEPQNSEQILTGYLEDFTVEQDHANKVNEYSNKKISVLNILSQKTNRNQL